MLLGETVEFINTSNKYIMSEEKIKNKVLNLQSIYSIITSGFINGNDTLIEGIKRKAWNDEEIFIEMKNEEINPSEHALKFEKLLYEEIEEKIKGYTKIGITLSGGLDSRIVAGLLRKKQLNSKNHFEVIVYNWGVDDSRDVIYAKRIAKEFNWKYKRLRMDPEVLRNNFEMNIKIGCEISPIHLHNLWQVSIDNDSEIVLAGTYGDSIGRGYFSGKHVSQNTNNVIVKDYFNLFTDEAKRKFNNKILSEKLNIPNKIIGISNNENDQYANYLRRLLGTAMSVISINKPVKQIFTSVKVIEHMLQLPPAQRTDEYYRHILLSLPNNIGHIPYAKNGKDFTNPNSEIQDNFYSKSHYYGKWLRNELKPFIKENTNFEILNSLNIFNEKNLKYLFKSWEECDELTNNRFDEIVSFLCNLSMFIERNNIQINPLTEKKENYFFKRRNNLISYVKINSYKTIRNVNYRRSK